MMVRIVRAVVGTATFTLVVVVAAAVLRPEDERGGHSLAFISGVVGAFVLAQIVGWMLRSNTEMWRRSPPLVKRPSGPLAPPMLASVRENQGIIVAATTANRRSRERLARRLMLLGCTDTRRLEDASTSDDVLSIVDDLLTELEEEHVL